MGVREDLRTGMEQASKQPFTERARYIPNSCGKGWISFLFTGRRSSRVRGGWLRTAHSGGWHTTDQVGAITAILAFGFRVFDIGTVPRVGLLPGRSRLCSRLDIMLEPITRLLGHPSSQVHASQGQDEVVAVPWQLFSLYLWLPQFGGEHTCCSLASLYRKTSAMMNGELLLKDGDAPRASLSC